VQDQNVKREVSENIYAKSPASTENLSDVQETIIIESSDGVLTMNDETDMEE
jgi:hypothetical protein